MSSYSGSPLYFPRDVYVVLFDPLPFSAHGGGQMFEALQNAVLIVMLFLGLRSLRILPRASLARPYLIMCVIYVISFCYFFASLGNLGLIAREATVMVPLYLVLLCVPRGPRHGPPATSGSYAGQRAERKRAMAQGRPAF